MPIKKHNKTDIRF